MVVHCSAGVGRTGTLIAIDYNMDMAAKTGKVDVLGSMNLIRRQRSTMVQTEDQYVFLYRALCDGCVTDVTDMTPVELRKHFDHLKENSTNMDAEFRRLAEGVPVIPRTESGQNPVNKPKNRYQNILPVEATRVKLRSIAGVIGSDYINANYLDGFKVKGAIIATQDPLETTVGDFWRMIWETEVHSILMLTSDKDMSRVRSEQYWPDTDEKVVTFGEYQITLVSERNLKFAMERTMRVMDLVSETAREVKQWQYLEWSESKVPLNGKNILKIIELIDNYAEMQQKMGNEESIYGNAKAVADHNLVHHAKPLVIHCSSGLGRTGTISSIHVGLKRLQDEDKVDIFTVCFAMTVSIILTHCAGRQASAYTATGHGPEYGERAVFPCVTSLCIRRTSTNSSTAPYSIGSTFKCSSMMTRSTRTQPLCAKTRKHQASKYAYSSWPLYLILPSSAATLLTQASPSSVCWRFVMKSSSRYVAETSFDNAPPVPSGFVVVLKYNRVAHRA
jgi:protein tyrosine phosphatase